LQRLAKFVAVVASAAALTGCGGGGGRDYKIKADQQATITGTVKFGETKVPVNCVVTFFNSDEGITAVGFVDESGKYALKPAEKETGLPAGKYQVTITPPPAPPLTKEEYAKMEASAMAMPQKTYKELPTKFYNSMTSGLVFDVTPGANSFDIDLSK
jgi:hypothetical protein